MNFGILEIILIILSWLFTGIVHLVIFLLTRTSNWRLPHKVLLIYGVPAIFTLSVLVTPPDLLSSFVIAIPCQVIYAGIVICWIAVSYHYCKLHEQTS